jgi:hypothetical protein
MKKFLYGFLFVFIALIFLAISDYHRMSHNSWRQAIYFSLSMFLFGNAFFLFPKRKCNYCQRGLFLGLGADHFICAIWNYPWVAIRGWGYFLLYSIYFLLSYINTIYNVKHRLYQVKEMRLHVAIMGRKFSKTQCLITIYVRMLLTGPLVLYIIHLWITNNPISIMSLMTFHFFLMFLVWNRSLRLFEGFVEKTLADLFFLILPGTFLMIPFYYGYKLLLLL